MDTSNSANVSLPDRDEGRLRTKSARSTQHSLSNAMAEALYQPHTLTQPKPLASRVKDAGKKFLKHNQTCQWIQFIQEQPEPLENKKDKRRTRAGQDSEVVPHVKEGCSELGQSPGRRSSPSYEEQLRSLQKQQEELQEQQRRLEEQLEQQRRARQLLIQHELQQPKQDQPEFCETKYVPLTISPKPRVEEKDAPFNGAPARFRRRLKGCVAQSFAERDEGSIGSLLYNQKVQEIPIDRRLSVVGRDHHGNGIRNAQEGRQYAMSQESGSTLCQLLVQMPSSSSFDVTKNASDCSATITDTVTTDNTAIKEKEANQDL